MIIEVVLVTVFMLLALAVLTLPSGPQRDRSARSMEPFTCGCLLALIVIVILVMVLFFRYASFSP